MPVWPEVQAAKAENRHEIKFSGAAISERISRDGLDLNICRLSNLNLLTISDTCLTKIPDEIKHLSNLQSLLLFGNKIDVINESISHLSKLKVLDLSRNLISEVPDCINKLEDLTNINLSSNNISMLAKIHNLPRLMSFDISNNKLKDFPDFNESLHLADLRLNGNNIETIPGSIVKNLPVLKNFDVSDNNVKEVPGEVAALPKLKEMNLKGNRLLDKRLLKLVDQCRTKQILDYVRQHCPKMDTNSNQSSVQGGGGKKGKKSQQNKNAPNETDCSQVEDLCHTMSILHINDKIPNVKIVEGPLAKVRPHIVCCIVKNLLLTSENFKKFIQLQTKLHDTICDKRNLATIATHDFDKIEGGDLTYTARDPKRLLIRPLMRQENFTGDKLFQQLRQEAENLRKEKKRNVYSGIHKYLYLLEGKPLYPCLLDGSNRVISFPPITNSDITKMSPDTKTMFIEVTSQKSLQTCKTVLDKLLQELLLLGITGPATDKPSSFNHMEVQQVKIVDPEGNLKCVYPSRTDCIYEDAGADIIKVDREA